MHRINQSVDVSVRQIDKEINPSGKIFPGVELSLTKWVHQMNIEEATGLGKELAELAIEAGLLNDPFVKSDELSNVQIGLNTTTSWINLTALSKNKNITEIEHSFFKTISE